MCGFNHGLGYLGFDQHGDAATELGLSMPSALPGWAKPPLSTSWM